MCACNSHKSILLICIAVNGSFYIFLKASDTVEKQPNCFANTSKMEEGLNNRTTFKGNFKNDECKIELKNVTLTDSGNWTCEMESYVFGPLRGTVKRKELSVKVIGRKSKAKLFNKLKLKLRKRPKYYSFI